MNTLRLSYSNTAFFWVFDADRSLGKYDTRLGRRWNMDPVVKEYESPYACFGNNPIFIIDWNGDDTGKVTVRKSQFPNVYNTHLMGIIKQPNIVGGNGKVYITYDSNRDNAKARRKAAVTLAKKIFASLGLYNSKIHDMDEFPFASTKEGGENAAANPVPRGENRSHGGLIGNTVIKYKMRTGDPFEITLIDDTKKEKKPAPRTIPATEPKPVIRPYIPIVPVLITPIPTTILPAPTLVPIPANMPTLIIPCVPCLLEDRIAPQSLDRLEG